MNNRKISFHFLPYYDESRIEKSDSRGRKRKYVNGVASGMKVDAHGERLTKNAIDSMMRQANTGDLLLYSDSHGIKDNEDIGILDSSELLPNGDWLTSFRLFDEYDGEDFDMRAKNNNILWRKFNGLPPYTKKRQKGFSIEGFVPEKSILSMSKDGHQRVIDDVILEGVVLVPKPAYNSVAEAVYKCLGEMSPTIETKVRKGIETALSDALARKENESSYYSKKYEIESTLDEEIRKIMEDPFANERERLEILFDEYKSLMTKLIIQSTNAFEKKDIVIDNDIDNSIFASEKMKELLLKTAESANSVLLKLRKGVTKCQ